MCEAVIVGCQPRACKNKRKRSCYAGSQVAQACKVLGDEGCEGWVVVMGCHQWWSGEAGRS